MTHLHDGTRDVRAGLEFLGTSWPNLPFSCCAVRRADGRRHVFGPSDGPRDGFAAAIAASCAVPGYFAPVEVDGEAYLDGGIASTTNADVLPGDVDLAIVFAPMSSCCMQSRFFLDRLVRERTANKLRSELTTLEGRGVRTVVFAPGEQTLAHLGHDFMSDAAAAEVVMNAFLDTGEQSREQRVAEWLGPVGAQVA